MTQNFQKTLSCEDCWITEVPIRPPKKPRAETALKTPVKPVEEQKPLMKPFKSISAEICSVQPLTLAKVLGEIGKEEKQGNEVRKWKKKSETIEKNFFFENAGNIAKFFKIFFFKFNFLNLFTKICFLQRFSF